MRLKVEFVGEHIPHYIPEYAKHGDAGFDLRADIQQKVVLHPGQTKMVPTGVRFEIPDGFEIQVRSRSGLAAKNGVFVLNAPGTLDTGYRGVPMAILHNSGDKTFWVEPGMRICQAVMNRFEVAEFEEGPVSEDTERGASGFGSSGTK